MSDKFIEDPYGFVWNALLVQRAASLPGGSVCLRLTGDGGKQLDVYCSPAGHSLRVFSEGVEWKPVER